ncbi:hypothetical protein KFE25_009256 [Diacronema lutheri]|uniref:Uncharacterized protein n=1 Tax=Diacronema lutheri TaxID=2081491 RepID=A0A8J5XZG5_DIALT|nr:hypothetical protein KFE25_009256 [Diacronema lutheri]
MRTFARRALYARAADTTPAPFVYLALVTAGLGPAALESARTSFCALQTPATVSFAAGRELQGTLAGVAAVEALLIESHVALPVEHPRPHPTSLEALSSATSHALPPWPLALPWAQSLLAYVSHAEGIRSLEDVHALLDGVDWERALRTLHAHRGGVDAPSIERAGPSAPAVRFQVQTVRSGSHAFRSVDVSRVVEAAVAARFPEWTIERASSAAGLCDVLMCVALAEDRLLAGLHCHAPDPAPLPTAPQLLTLKPLRTEPRPWLVHCDRKRLRPSTARLLLELAGLSAPPPAGADAWRVLDPFGGVGTIALEAACGFERVHAFSTDRDAAPLSMARANAQIARGFARAGSAIDVLPEPCDARFDLVRQFAPTRTAGQSPGGGRVHRVVSELPFGTEDGYAALTKRDGKQLLLSLSAVLQPDCGKAVLLTFPGLSRALEQALPEHNARVLAARWAGLAASAREDSAQRAARAAATSAGAAELASAALWALSSRLTVNIGGLGGMVTVLEARQADELAAALDEGGVTTLSPAELGELRAATERDVLAAERALGAASVALEAARERAARLKRALDEVPTV